MPKYGSPYLAGLLGDETSGADVDAMISSPLAAQHESELLQGLSADERVDLARLLDRLAEERGLDREAHVGYRDHPEDSE